MTEYPTWSSTVSRCFKHDLKYIKTRQLYSNYSKVSKFDKHPTPTCKLQGLQISWHHRNLYRRCSWWRFHTLCASLCLLPEDLSLTHWLMIQYTLNWSNNLMPCNCLLILMFILHIHTCPHISMFMHVYMDLHGFPVGFVHVLRASRTTPLPRHHLWLLLWLMPCPGTENQPPSNLQVPWYLCRLYHGRSIVFTIYRFWRVPMFIHIHISISPLSSLIIHPRFTGFSHGSCHGDGWPPWPLPRRSQPSYWVPGTWWPDLRSRRGWRWTGDPSWDPSWDSMGFNGGFFVGFIMV